MKKKLLFFGRCNKKSEILSFKNDNSIIKKRFGRRAYGNQKSTCSNHHMYPHIPRCVQRRVRHKVGVAGNW